MKNKIVTILISTMATIILGLGLYINDTKIKPTSLTPPDVVKTMLMQNQEGSLSPLSFVVKNMGYMQIFSALSVGDVRNVWNDFIIFESLGIIDVNIFINSPGGDAFSGLALADHIRTAQNNGFTVTAYASGIVASAAVPIYAICDERIAAPGTIFMVHETSIWKWPGRETHSDIRSQGKLMDMLRANYLKILADRSNLSAEEWASKEVKTSWFNAEMAKSWGLVDKIE